MQASVVAAAVTLYLALRAHDVPVRLAAPLALAVFETVIYQQYCTGLGPDYLAAAFAMSSVPLALRRDRDGGAWWLVAPSGMVALAALTKVTAVAYAAPITWWLATRRRRPEPLWFALGTTALFAAAISAVQIGSQGVFLESFRATASGEMDRQASGEQYQSSSARSRSIPSSPYRSSSPAGRQSGRSVRDGSCLPTATLRLHR
jgi:hypothetical protein